MFNDVVKICPGTGSWFSEEYFHSQTICRENYFKSFLGKVGLETNIPRNKQLSEFGELGILCFHRGK